MLKKKIKTTFISVPVDQKSGHNLAGFLFQNLSQATIKVSDGAAVIPRLDWGRICFQAHPDSWPSAVI